MLEHILEHCWRPSGREPGNSINNLSGNAAWPLTNSAVHGNIYRYWKDSASQAVSGGRKTESMLRVEDPIKIVNLKR